MVKLLSDAMALAVEEKEELAAAAAPPSKVTEAQRECAVRLRRRQGEKDEGPAAGTETAASKTGGGPRCMAEAAALATAAFLSFRCSARSISFA